MAKSIADLLPSNPITHIYGPKDQEQEELLNNGAILKRSESKFTHKVILRDGRYPTEIKRSLLNYLDNLGDDASVSKGCRRMLQSNYTHTWGVWFYINDPSVVTFINLMDPTIVSNIHTLVSVSNK
jgi:hypothetical protein